MFVLPIHIDPYVCARSYSDKHLHIMPYTIEKIMYRVIHNIKPTCDADTSPWVDWAKLSRANAIWMAQLGVGCIKEHICRFQKLHFCDYLLRDALQKVNDLKIPCADDITTFPEYAVRYELRAYPDCGFVTPQMAVKSYQIMYNIQLKKDHGWTNRDKPQFIKDFEEFKQF